MYSLKKIFSIAAILGIALVSLFAFSNPAQAAGPWFVDPAGNDANTCLAAGAGTACKTIQAAVNKAVAGDTITVAAGTYAEHVAVNKSLTINGANVGVAGNVARGAESIVDGTDTDAPFAITANNVTIDGFTIKNGSNGGFDSGIWSQAGTQDSIIRNNIITANAFGIWAECGGNCLIQANLFDGNNKAGTGAGTHSISADATTGLTINNNEFKNDTVDNPINMQATLASLPGAHKNLAITNNNFHNNTGASVMYILGVTGGTITGNTVLPAADVTGISLSGADANVTVTGNTITGAARGVRVEDAGYYGASGGNSNIVVNRNDVSNDSAYGVGNTDAAIASLDGTCNWWGSATGPGPVGPGSGDPVTGNVTFQPWLTTNDLSPTTNNCNGVPPEIAVHIFKYIDGAQATAVNANNSAFPMLTTFTSSNLGSVTDAPFTLSPTGWGSGDAPYEASFVGSNAGADYATHEDLATSLVGASCDGVNTFALTGYTSGDTLAAAQAGTPTLVTPSFTNLQGTKYVIVWNHRCPPMVKVHILKYLDGQVATAPAANNFQFPMTATWKAANLSGGVTTSGMYVLGNHHGSAPDLYGADTSAMDAPAQYSTHEITGTNTQVLPIGCKCAPGKFRLVGYTVSAISFADAATKSPSATIPNFTNLTGDRYVIVWNRTCPLTGSLIVTKNTLGGNRVFEFEGRGLDDFKIKTVGGTGSKTLNNVPVGTYTVKEETPHGWKQVSNSCKDVVVTANATTTCTIVNQKKSNNGHEDEDSIHKYNTGD